MTPRQQPEPVEGYEPFFGLREAPFNLAPDPRFLFASASHSAALAQVAYALQRREPLVIVTGDIGTGKTLLCRTVLQRLPGKTFLSVISDPLLERDDLLKQMLQDFGIISKDRSRLTATSRHDLVQTLHEFLGSLAPLQAHAVVIIDEAQHLQPDVLEQIRLLANIDDAHGTALAIILVGQPDLEQLLSRPELRQLQQRVSRSLRLAALNRDEVQQYVEHRLSLARDSATQPAVSDETEFEWDLIDSAGAKPSVEFATDAIDALSQLSGGVPRVINLLCDRSLEGAHASRMRVIDRRLIHAAARELGIGTGVTETRPGLNLVPRRTEGASVESVSTPGPPEPEVEVEITHPAVEIAAPGFSAVTHLTTTASRAKYAALALLVAVAGAAILFGTRTARPTAAGQGPSSPPVSSPTRASGAQPERATPDAGTLPQKAAAGAGTSTVVEIATPASGGEQFDLVVASFRTDARAASVAAEVAALGLPIRRRASDGWQQVIAGPFASRTDAESAQQRLGSAGLTGTQITLTTR